MAGHKVLSNQFTDPVGWTRRSIYMPDDIAYWQTDGYTPDEVEDHEDSVEKYQREGGPPPVAYLDRNGDTQLIDGAHRAEAQRRQGRTALVARVPR